MPITTEHSFNAETYTLMRSCRSQSRSRRRTSRRPTRGSSTSVSPTAGVTGASSPGHGRDHRGRRGRHGCGWRSLVVQQAPLNAECADDPDPDETCESATVEVPADWMSPDFDDSAWVSATVSAAEVGPKEAMTRSPGTPRPNSSGGPISRSTTPSCCARRSREHQSAHPHHHAHIALAGPPRAPPARSLRALSHAPSGAQLGRLPVIQTLRHHVADPTSSAVIEVAPREHCACDLRDPLDELRNRRASSFADFRPQVGRGSATRTSYSPVRNRDGA